MEGMSLLPMIKCSSCGVGIEITQLADHICTPAADSVDQPLSPKLDRAATFGGASNNSKSIGLPKSRGPPLKVDPYAANKPFRYEHSPLSPSPLSPGRSKMNRSATSPLPQSNAPPSPDLMGNMDSPFPHISASRIQTSTSAKPRQLDRSAPSGTSSSYGQDYAQSSPLFAPLSPRTDGVQTVLKRMNTIAPGPFDGQRGYDRRPSTSGGPQSQALANSQGGHRRTDTQGSMRSAPNGRSSLASSNFSTDSSGLPSRPIPAIVGAMLPPPPPVPPVQIQEKTEGIDAFLQRLQEETMGPSTRNRSKSPMRQNDESKIPVRQDDRSRSPMRQDRSKSPVRPETAQEQRPDAPRATSRRPPSNLTSKSPQRSNDTKLPAARTRDRSRDKDLPPLPAMSNFAGRDIPQDPVYTPSDSGRSEDSYASFGSGVSSRSSPPQSEAGHSRQASKISRPDYMVDEFVQRTLSPDTFLDSRTAPYTKPDIRQANESNDRSRTPEALLKPPTSQMPTTPQTPLDPAIQKGFAYEKRKEESASPRDPALNYAVSPQPPQSITSPEPLPRQRQQEPQPTPRRAPTTGTTSNRRCRGCGEAITGKSVKDSSGRLTGRYHKECFVCRTCRSPFPTAEFYVFQNAPFCHQHYHVLNGSLCRACNRGIEGQYLETDQRLKFHPRCFACFTCRIVLKDDYYEVGRRNFCERHAYAEMGRRNNGMSGPGGPNSGRGQGRTQNLQKRRTRLMMMRN